VKVTDPVHQLLKHARRKTRRKLMMKSSNELMELVINKIYLFYDY